MIEFSGYLTGAALKHYCTWLKRICITFVFICACIGLPAFVLIFQNYVGVLKILVVYVVVFGLGLFFTPLFQVKHDIRQMRSGKNSNIPKRIYITANTIVSVSNKTPVKQVIENVKEVRDYGEYYALFFNNFSNYSQFVCQKNLLTKGSIEEFESLFEGKIVKKG